MILSESDAVWAADEFISYFENFTSIEDYLRHVKKSVIGYELSHKIIIIATKISSLPV